KSKRLFSFHCDSECIGFVEWRDDPFVIDIDRFEIKREYRGKGVGRYIVGVLMNFFKNHRKVVVRLFCEPKISVGFWRRLGFIQLPPTDYWNELTFYHNLFPAQGTIEDPDALNKVELCNLEPYQIKVEKPMWTWNFNIKSVQTEQPILQPCNSNWNLKITRYGEIVSQGKVKHISDAGNQIYFNFLFIY